MEEKVNIKQALRVYQKIATQGSRHEDGFKWQGLHASSDFDGYTVYLSDGTTSLTLYFHNKFSLDSPGTKATATFLQRLARIDED